MSYLLDEYRNKELMHQGLYASPPITKETGRMPIALSNVTTNPTGRYTCPHCAPHSRIYKTPHAVNVHIGKEHKQ